MTGRDTHKRRGWWRAMPQTPRPAAPNRCREVDTARGDLAVARANLYLAAMALRIGGLNSQADELEAMAKACADISRRLP